MLGRELEPKRVPHAGAILRTLCEVTNSALGRTGDVGLTQLPGWVLVCGYSTEFSAVEISGIFLCDSWSEIKP